MKATGLNAFMARVDAAEYGLCRTPQPRCCLRPAAPDLPGGQPPGRRPHLVRAAGWCCRCCTAAPRCARCWRHGPDRGGRGRCCTRCLKRIFVRERPFITHCGHRPRRRAAGSLQLPLRPHPARGVLHLAGERALSGTGLGAAAAGGPDRRLARGARAALPLRRAGRRRPRRGTGRGWASAAASHGARAALQRAPCAPRQPSACACCSSPTSTSRASTASPPPSAPSARTCSAAGRAHAAGGTALRRPASARPRAREVLRVAVGRRAGGPGGPPHALGRAAAAARMRCRAASSTWCTSTPRSSPTTPACASRAAPAFPCVATYHTFFEEYLHHYVPVVPRAARPLHRAPLHALAVRRRCRRSSRPPSRCARCSDEYGVRTPIHVLPTGLAADRFRSGRRGTRFRAPCGIAAERPLLTYVGRVAHEKNIGFLVQVLRRVLARAAAGAAGDRRRGTGARAPARPGGRARPRGQRALRRLPRARYRSCSTATRPPMSSCSPRAPRPRAWCCWRRWRRAPPVVSTAELGTRSILRPASGALVVPEEEPSLRRRRGARARGRRACAQSWPRARRVYARTWSSAAMARRLGELYAELCVRPQPRSASPPDAARRRKLRDSAALRARSELHFPRVPDARVLERRMGAKRALIVDDSKSARLFLARVLENYEIDVDSAESAEAAIDYLTQQPARRDLHGSPHARHGRLAGRAGHQERPAHRDHPHHDVHLPGRGAVPGQARALGAVGRIAQADQAHRCLQGALPAAPGAGPAQRSSSRASRPSTCASTADAEAADTAPACFPSPSPTARCASTSRSCAARSSPASTRRPTASPPRCARCCCESLPLNPRPTPYGRRPPPAPAPTPWAWIIAGTALAMALLSTALWWRSERALESLSAQVAQLRDPARSAPRGRARAGRRRRGRAARAAGRGEQAHQRRSSPMAPMPSAARGWRSSASCSTGWRARTQNGVVEIRTYRGALLPDGQRDGWLLAGPGGDALLRAATWSATPPTRRCAAPSASRSRSPTSSATSAAPPAALTGRSGLGGRSANLALPYPPVSRRSHRRGVEPRRQRQQPN